MSAARRGAPTWILFAASTGLGYAVVAVLWLLTSDAIYQAIVSDPVWLARLRAWDEPLFAAVNCVLLLVLVGWYGRLLEQSFRRASERERALGELANTSPNPIALVGSDGRILLANLAFAHLFGQTMGGITGRALARLTAPHAYGNPDLHGLLARAREAGTSAERMVLLDRDGAPLPVYFSINAWQGEDGRGGFVLSGVELREIEEQQARLQGLHEALGALAAATVDIDRMAAQALSSAATLTRTDLAGIALFEPGTHSMTYRWLHGFPAETATEELEQPFPHTAGLAGAVVSTGAPTVIEDYRSASNALGAFRDHGLRAGLGVPVFIGDEIAGALVVGSTRRPDRFSADAVSTLEAIARQVSVALRHHRMLDELHSSKRALTRVVDMVPDVLFSATIPEYRLLFVSPGIEALCGLDAPDCVADPTLFEQRIHQDDRAAVKASHADALRLGSAKAEYRLVHPARGVRHVESDGRVERTDDGTGVLFGVIRDVTDRKKAEQRAKFLAFYDPATGLPNFQGFCQRRDECGDAPGALVYVELDRYGMYVDLIGEEGAEGIVHALIDRIRSVVGPQDIVGRLVRGELLLWLPAPQPVERVERVASAIVERLASPVGIEGQEFALSVSIGFSVAPEDGRSAAVLFNRADAALRNALSRGGGAIERYEPALSERRRKIVSLEGRLRRALERQEFVIDYQPVVNLADGRMVGAEALLRWRCAEGEVLPPGEFLPVAEETGLIVPIGDWVFHEVCSQVRRWNDEGFALFGSINVSKRQFRGGDLVARLLPAVEAARVRPTHIEVEITEAAVEVDPVRAEQVMRSLAEAGVRIAIDDFGTAATSIKRLQSLPVRKLKIDRTFVSGADAADSGLAVVDGIVHIARALDLLSHAEGIETEGQLTRLRLLGCAHGQGWLFAPPMSAARIVELMRGDEPLRPV